MATRNKTTSAAETTVLPAADTPEWRMMIARQQLAEIDPQDENDVAEADISDQLRASFGEAPGDKARVQLWKYDLRTRAREHCADYYPDEYINGGMAMVRREWGAGSYEFRAYGSKGLLTHGKFRIAEKPDAPQVVTQPQSEMSQLMAMMVQGQRDTQAMLATILNRPAENPLQTIGPMLAIMKDMREAMGMNIAPPAAPVVDPVAQITQLITAAQAVKNGVKELTEDADNAAPDKEPTLMSMLPQGLALVREAMGARNNTPMLALPNSLQGVPSETDDQIQQPAPETENDMNSLNPLQKLMMAGFIAKIGEMATANTSPAIGAKFIFKKMPAEMIEMLDLPNWFELLTTIAPGLSPYKDWLYSVKPELDALVAAAG